MGYLLVLLSAMFVSDGDVNTNKKKDTRVVAECVSTVNDGTGQHSNYWDEEEACTEPRLLKTRLDNNNNKKKNVDAVSAWLEREIVSACASTGEESPYWAAEEDCHDAILLKKSVIAKCLKDDVETNQYWLEDTELCLNNMLSN